MRLCKNRFVLRSFGEKINRKCGGKSGAIKSYVPSYGLTFFYARNKYVGTRTCVSQTRTIMSVIRDRFLKKFSKSSVAMCNFKAP